MYPGWALFCGLTQAPGPAQQRGFRTQFAHQRRQHFGDHGQACSRISQELLRLKLSALGGSGRRWWFVDGQPLAESVAEAAFNQAFSRTGEYQLSVLDESGETARVAFQVSE